MKIKLFRKFKIAPENEKFVSTELSLRGIINYTVEEDGQLYCYAKCSGEKFHAAHTRAVCERLTKETGLIHMSKAEMDTPGLFDAVNARHGSEDGSGHAVII